jgi:hypothetical protein
MKKYLTILFPVLTILTVLVFMSWRKTVQEPFETQNETEKDPYVLPKILWKYWDSEPLPKLIEQIHQNNLASLKGWSIQLITKSTLERWIPKQNYPIHFERLRVQHQADWIRLYLLKKYGGCWFDASIIVNDGSQLDALRNESIAKRSQWTGFSNKCKNDGKNIPLGLENWFIMAPKHSKVIELWLDEFESAIQMGFINYKRKLVDLNVNLTKVYGAHDRNVYFTHQACLQYVFQRLAGPVPVLIKKSEDDMLKIQTECRWDAKCIQAGLLNPESKQIPYIKLIRFDRKVLDELPEFYLDDVVKANLEQNK